MNLKEADNNNHYDITATVNYRYFIMYLLYSKSNIP